MIKVKFPAIVVSLVIAVISFGCAERPSNENALNANATPMASPTVSPTPDMGARRYDPKITEQEYERERARYEREATDLGDKIGTTVKDGWLWVKVRAALAAQDDLRDTTINVDVDNAAVTLRGTVANAQQKSSAEKAAKGVSGVASVRNNLTVSAST